VPDAADYGFTRVDAVPGTPGSSVWSGLIINNSLAPNGLTFMITVSGVGSYTSQPFNLPQGEIIPFKLTLTNVPFANQKTGTFELLSSGGASDTTSFVSDPCTAALLYQNLCVGHQMPGLVYPNIPGSDYTVVAPLTL
jgi:hypothetical protein